ncbi:NgoPII family restriction endonuclease [Fusobacterium nucleatum]|uniref:NgoPII restriction endonuclease n=1 Tax=Fusobacterium nucleatum TaxID=851 RepID=A0A133NN89_FUSNU|nr:NgoPII family restriction endonuclease [Fusobacterium nucleatum]KXA17737.1 NgoPII restriction endonuclease [Fusobacterium nucleatum]MCL4576777.1 restriction endonuclease NgoPII [Fusobacterium nucleatum YWH7056]MCL4580575.1 restriction endonuclease NgoPII [Fusobacterium nucleatum YWH7199]MCL4582365.1 restriction endonuclease NgoPII [Fusobacterium nucleatum YWH7054]MCL4592742.1 restriction endonuclease NgoPII [Fusobacterium nucleatum YWH7053]
MKNNKNIIDAIINIVKNPIVELKEYSISHNRANSMGEALEEYVKDIFSGTLFETDKNKRMEIISEVFSYLGNTNNPPDSILRDGDAIEVKKIENKSSSLALNSSYPKAKLYSNSSMITDACRNCEEWKEKDIIYAIGTCEKNKLTSLIFVYGEDYAAENKIYENVKNKIKFGIETINGLEFSETNEIGRVNRVDPLGITYFRIRGMWGIENPIKVFDYIYERDNTKQFNFMALINDDKYNSFFNREELENLEKENKYLEIRNVKIKNPNNPAQLRSAKLITFKI